MAIGYYSYRNNQNFINTKQWVYHTTRVLYHIEQTQSNALKTEELLTRYVISGDSALLLFYAKEIEEASDHYRNLRLLTQDNPDQQVRMDSMSLIGRRKLIAIDTLIRLRQKSKTIAEKNLTSADYQNLNQHIHSILKGLRKEEDKLLEQRIAQSALELRQYQATFIFLMATIVIILVSVLIIVNRNFRARTIAEYKTNLINKELEAFTYSVSHDLRAPLRSIRGFSQVLSDDYGNQLNAEGNRLLGKVIRSASQMGQLIDDLLDFSRIGRKELFLSRINTQNQVMEVIEEVTDNDPAKKQYINVSSLPEMKGDQNMLKLVWTNLISNAVKYSRKNADPKIEIGSIKKNGGDIFYVKDNGVGFDMKYSNKLFNVFQRLHNNTEFEGTGVGLALAHRIITRHNGTIWTDAKINEGATFYFSIPN